METVGVQLSRIISTFMYAICVLVGAQINGQSTVEIYRQCLLLGCRCVELDCWIQNDDIIITHGVVSGLWVCTTISFEVSEVCVGTKPET